MPRNGSGGYSLPQSAFVPGTTISSAAVNSDLSDIAQALTGSVATDGQSNMSGPLKAAAGNFLAPSITFASDATSGFFLGSSQIGVSILGSVVGYFGAAGWLSAAGAPLATPVSAVTDYAGSAAPPGWLLCYGQAVSRTTYALLFAAIGTTYGSGDGATTFTLPDARGRVVAGRDDMGGPPANRLTTAGAGIDGITLGAAGGQQTVTLSVAQLPVVTPAGTVAIIDPGHEHTYTNPTIGSNQLAAGAVGSTKRDPTINGDTVTVNTTGITAAFTGTSFGGGTAHTNTQPTIVMNKIIYTGVA